MADLKRVLSIETSCDETAIALVEGSVSGTGFLFNFLADRLNSQAELHQEFGGVYPTLAKREHIRNLVPLLASLCEEQSSFFTSSSSKLDQAKVDTVHKWLSHEPELIEPLIAFAETFAPKNIDGIAVTIGPGLAPALWVGLNVARSLSLLWDVPLVPTNHMEGHFISGLHEGGVVEYPILGLLVSGGHTELVLSKEPFHYEVIGSTRDDAAGEAFDKGARLLDLPYPGGPELSKLTSLHRTAFIDHTQTFDLPRPMLSSHDLDFSYSGLKTALRYLIRDLETAGKNIDDIKPQLAREYEDAILDVLIAKTKKALQDTGAHTLVIAGGVSANKELRQRVEVLAASQGVVLKIPPFHLCTDNAVMIGMAGALRLARREQASDLANLKADGNLSF